MGRSGSVERGRGAWLLSVLLLAVGVGCAEPEDGSGSSRSEEGASREGEDSSALPPNREELPRRNHASPSPDGVHLVYHGARANGRVALFVARTDGTDERLLFGSDTVHAQEPRWSPRGDWIAFVGGESREVGGFSLYLIRPDGRDRHAIAHSEVGKIKSPTWSPDGRRLAYEVRDYDSGWSSIWRVDVDGGGDRRLSPADSGIHRHPRWSPRGDRLLVGWIDPAVEGEGDLYVAPVLDLSQREWLPKAPGIEGMMAWSPDERFIVFSRWVAESDQDDLFLLELASGRVVNLTRTPDASEYFPAFSPDGATLYYDRMTTDGESYFSQIGRLAVPGKELERRIGEGSPEPAAAAFPSE